MRDNGSERKRKKKLRKEIEDNEIKEKWARLRKTEGEVKEKEE